MMQTACARRLAFVLLAALAAPHAAGQPDQLHLRDGSTLEGNIVQHTPDGYFFQRQPGREAPRRVPKHAVRYVVYGDAAKGASHLRLADARRLTRALESSHVRILPAEAFGDALKEAVATAQESIWIAAYYFRDIGGGPIGEFYATLKEKAAAGVEVIFLAEFGTGTPMPIRNDVLNFAASLAASGVRTYFIQERRVQHKKLIIVDRKRVLLGSSNLTQSGIGKSNEMNVWVEDAAFAAAAVRDFRNLQSTAKSAENLRY